MSLKSTMNGVDDDVNDNGRLPLVSVIVVCYNVEQFLDEALNSVWAQGYPCVEVVLCDDASNDQTRQIMRRHDELHPGRVVLSFSDVNQGFTRNWRRGLEQANGKYVIKLDGDDVWLPGKLWAQVQYMEENPMVYACFHDQEIFNNDDGKTIALMSEVDPPHTGGLREVVRYGTFACVTVMVRNCKRLPMPRTLLKYGSDWMWTFDVLKNGGAIAYIDGVYSRYRRHGGNVTSNRMMRVQLDHLLAALLMAVHRPNQIANIAYRLIHGGIAYLSRIIANKDYFQPNR